MHLLILGKNIVMLAPINHLIIKLYNQRPSRSMKTKPNLLEELCDTFVNVHKISPSSKSYLRQVQTTLIFKSLKELMKQQKTKV